MAKTFKKTSRRKVKYTLTPKEASKIIQDEFTDSKGNKINVNVNITPHKPSTSTLEIKRQYKE